MGLSSWIQNLLARPKAPSARSPREDFIQLYLNRLEDRRVLNADFALVGGDLVLNNFSAGESLDIQQSGGNYLFVLNDGTWTDQDADPNTSGDGTDTLSVPEGLVADGTIQNLQITDPADNDLGIEFVGDTDFSALGGRFEIIGAGNITQTVGTQVEVSTFDVDAASLDLDETGNDFGSVTINVSGAASLQDANDLTLGTVSTGDAFQVTAAGVITLTDNINTDSNTNGGDVTLTGDVLLAADIAIDTDAASADGGVTVTGTIDADAAANNRILTITSGDGDVDLQDDLGPTQALASLEINSAGGTGAITLGNIGSTGTAGAGTVTIGNNDTGSVNFQGTQYVTSSIQTYRAAAGTNFQVNAGTATTFQTIGTAGADPIEFRSSGIELATGSDLNLQTAGGTDDEILLNQGLQGQLDENVTLNAIHSEIGGISDVQSFTVTGTAQLNGDITTSASTANSNFVQFNDVLDVATAATIDTSAAGGNIVFADRADGNGEDFTLDAGAGTITVTQLGRLSTDRQFNDLTITADTFNFSVGLFTHAQAGDAGDIAITANSVNVTGTAVINTTIDDSGNTDDGTLTVNGPINADGQILTVNVGTTDLDLSDAGNDFGTLLVTANNGTIVDADEIQLGASTLTGNYSVTAGGAITEAATPGVIDVDGNLTLAADGDLGAAGSGSLDVQVGGTASLTASGSDVFIESDEDLVINHLETAAAEADIVEITTTGTANLTLQVAAADFLNLETDDMTLTTEDGELAIQGDPLATGAITLVNTGTAGSVTLATDLQTDGGNIDLQNAPSVTIAENVILDTESGDDGNAGSVLFSAASGAAINAAVVGVQSLTVNTTSSGGTDGDINLSDIGTGIRLGDLNVTAGDGTITLNDTAGTADLAEILTDNGNVTFGSFTELTADTTVDTLGGNLDWQATEVFSDANGPHNLTIQTGGGNVDLGRLTDGPASTNFVNNLVIDTTNGTAGTLTLHGDITLANNFQYTGGATTLLNAGSSSLGLDSSITTLGTGTVQISATSGAANDIEMQDGTTITTTDGDATLQAANDVELSRVVVGGANIAGITAGGAIIDNTAGEGSGNENIVASDAGSSIDLQAADGIGSGTGVLGEDEDIDIDGVLLSAANSTSGAIQIFDANDIALGQVSNPARTVVIEVGGAITDADTTSEGSGNENIIAGDILLQAVSGIGSGTGALGDGEDIDINGDTLTATNTASNAVQIFEVDSIALNQVDNSGRTVVIEAGGAITDADTTSEGSGNENIIGNAIRLRAATGIGTSGTPMFGDGEDIDIDGVTLYAENTANGSIQITETNDIALDQIINSNRTVLIEGDGAITDADTADDSNPNISAASAGLMAGTGIGDGADLDTDVDTIAAVTDTGDINLDETDDLMIGMVGGVTGLTITNADAVMTGDDDIAVIAGGDLTVNHAVANNDAGDVTLIAENANDLFVNADIDAVAPGNITLEGENVTVAGATVEIMGTGTIATVDPRNGPLTGTGILTIVAPGTTTVGAGATLRTGGGVIQITTDDININATASIESDAASGGVVIIRNSTDGRDIELGGSTLADVLGITDAELDVIQADSLRIGRLTATNDAGNITFTAALTADPARLQTVQLFAGGNVTQANAAASFQATNIGIETEGMVAMTTAANNAEILAIEAADSIQFRDLDELTVGTINDAVDAAEGQNAVGVQSANSFVELITDGGNLIVSDTGQANDISAGGVNSANNLAINLTADGPDTSITVNSDADLESTAGTHRYTADNMDIQGTITATGQAVNLRNANADVAIDLGSATDANAATLELADAELDNITTNLLAIGRNTGNMSGDISVTDSISPGNTDTLHLITPGTVTDIAAGAIVESNLLIEAAGGATLDNLANNDVDTLAALVTGDGASLDFQDVDSVIVGTVDRLTVTNDADETVGTAAFSGIDTDGGDVTLITNSGVTVDQTINTTADDAGRDSGAIAINVLMAGDIEINAPLVTTGTTTGGNGEGGDITLTTANGDITNSAAGDLDASGGAGTVDGGDVLIDANGQNADAILRSTLATSGSGSVTVLADDSVTFESAGMIQAAGAGNVLVRANQDASDGDDEIAMADGSVINAGTGTVTLRTDGANGGDITLGRVVTQNTTAAAVTINSESEVLDGGDAGNLPDLEANAAGSTINITAVDGVGTSGNAVETSGRFFIVDNTAAGPINLVNMTDGLDVVIDRLTTAGGDVSLINSDLNPVAGVGRGSLTVQNTGVASGVVGVVNGGDINITTDGALTVIAPISSQGGMGGQLEVFGTATFDPGVAILLGEGNIRLDAGGTGTDGDILINTALTIDGPARFYAQRDIIISAPIITRVFDNVSTNTFVNATTTTLDPSVAVASDLVLSADNHSKGIVMTEEGDGVGGVLVQQSGQVVASGNLLIEGSDLFEATGLPAVNMIRNGVHVEADGGNDQVLASGNSGAPVFPNVPANQLTIRNRPTNLPGDVAMNNVLSDIVVGGRIGTTRPQTGGVNAGGNILINANDNIHLADNSVVFSNNSTGMNLITFGDATGRDPLVDDGVIGTLSNLVINSSGVTTFFGRVDGIDSLTTNTGGQTHIRGGLVSTVGSQIYNDAVLIDADTNNDVSDSESTTFVAGGNVNFNSAVAGLNLDGIVQDDLILNVAGTTTFASQVGANSGEGRIGDGTGWAITLNSTGETFFNGPVFTQSGILQNDPAGRITFRQNVNIDAGNMGSDFLADVTLDNVTILSNGNLSFGSGAVNTDELLIEAGSVLNTGPLSRNITVNSRVLDPAVGANQDLTLNLNAGNLLVNGSVGNEGTNNRFGNFVIVNAGDFLFGPDRMQSLFADSLIQQTGSGSTQLSSTVDVDDVEGVTIATAGVLYDAPVITNGQRVLTQAAGNIIYTIESSLTTAGGMVVSDAAGDIVMQETAGGVATIDADGGMVVLRSAGNLTMSQIRSQGGLVALTSTNGAVFDAGDQSGLAGAIGSNDVQASQLRIQTANGIATAGNLALETMVSNLDADNGNNGIQIVNTGNLVLGGVSGTSAQTFRNGLPTGIGLPPLNGVSTDNGQIVIRTNGTLTFAPGAAVESGTGRILQPTPMVTNVTTPLIDNDGIAVLSFDLGLPGETNFTAIVDWGDGSPPDIVPGLAGGQNHTIEHQFEENPDPNNPGADIRILFVVMNDPNIQLFGNNGGSLVTPDPPLPQPSPGVNEFVIAGISTNSLGAFSVIPAFPVTVINITPAVMIEEEELPPFFIPSTSVEAPPEESEDAEEEAEDLDLSGSDAEEEDEDEIVVRLRVFSPAGQKLREYEIESKYLANPAPLWARLPDGRYQIVVEEAGESIPVVVRDVEIRQHKVIRRFDRSRRGSDDQTSRLDNPEPTTPVSALNIDGTEPPIEAASSQSDQTESDPPIAPSHPDSVWENWQRPPKASRILSPPEDATTESDADPEDPSPLFTSAAAAGIVLGLRRRRTDRSADQQMTRFSPRAISPAARLRRKLRH